MKSQILINYFSLCIRNFQKMNHSKKYLELIPEKLNVIGFRIDVCNREEFHCNVFINVEIIINS